MLEFSNDWTKGASRTSLGSNTASFPNELNLEVRTYGRIPVHASGTTFEENQPDSTSRQC